MTRAPGFTRFVDSSTLDTHTHTKATSSVFNEADSQEKITQESQLSQLYEYKQIQIYSAVNQTVTLLLCAIKSPPT